LRVRADGLALVTFAVGEGLRVVEGNAAWTGGSQGLPGVAPLTWNGRPLLSARDYYPLAAVLLALAYLMTRWLRASPLGWSMLAIGRDPVLAGSLGVRAGPTKVAAWSLAGLLTGLAGGISACFAGFVSSVSFGVVQSFQLVVMVVLGGLGRPGGAVVGALVVLALDDQLQGHPGVRLAATGAAMIAVVIARSGAPADSAKAALLALRRSRQAAPL
jgi:branched-chain amino acid transport system permease protein